MNPPVDVPQLIRMAHSLREDLPVWADEDIAKALTVLRDVELPVARRVAALCWADPHTEHPGRLAVDGPWWRLCGLRSPERHGEPPARFSSETHRRGVEFCRQQLAEARQRHQEAAS